MQFSHKTNEVELIPYPEPSKYKSATKVTSLRDSTGKRRYNGSHHVPKSWKWEVVTVMVAIAVVIAIFVTLQKFDKRRISEWKFRINLNTLTAILATILRTALMYPAAQVISQEKWSWFASSPKRLNHLDAFDGGSRGPWGALLLLPLVVRHRPLTVLGILIIVLSLGIGSFVQQASKTTACPAEVVSSNAVIPVVRNLTRFASSLAEDISSNIGPNRFTQDRQTFESKVSFFRPDGDESVVRGSCSTANCRFPEWGYLQENRAGWMFTEHAKTLPVTHASMGLCSSCADMSSTATGSIETRGNFSVALISLPQIPKPSGEGNFSSRGLEVHTISRVDHAHRGTKVLDVEQLNFMYRPGGQQLDLKFLTELLDSATGYPGMGNFITNASIGFIDIFAMSRAPCSLDPRPGQSRCLPKVIHDYLSNSTVKFPARAGFAASRCVLYPCLRTYNGGVINGTLQQTLLGIGVAERGKERNDAPTNSSAFARSPSFGILQTPCRVSNINYGVENISTAPGERPERPVTLMLSGTALTEYPKECVYIMTKAFEDYRYEDSFVFFNGDCSSASNGIVCTQEPFVSLLGTNLNATHDSITAHMSAFARSVSEKLRMDERLLSPVSGTAFEPEVCFTVDLRWLLFPAALTFLTIALLIIILVPVSARSAVPVWKDSLLPLVLHVDQFEGLRSETQSERGRTTGLLLDIKDLEERANTLYVRLNGRTKVSGGNSDTSVLLSHIREGGCREP